MDRSHGFPLQGAGQDQGCCAEQPRELRGKNFLITNDHLKNDLDDGSVVIDLVGGSATNRSPVEPVMLVHS